jgi:hypothetical protein
MRRVMLAQISGVIGGVWLMAAPAVFAYAGRPAGHVHRIVGPLLVTVALVSRSAVTRGLRWANALFGVTLVLAVAVVPHGLAAGLSGIGVGLAVAAAAPFGGAVDDDLGAGWRSVVKAGAG